MLTSGSYSVAAVLVSGVKENSLLMVYFEGGRNLWEKLQLLKIGFSWML